MAFDEGLAQRIRERIVPPHSLRETRMFGGLGYMLNGNMCLGIWKDSLIVRVGQERAQLILQEPHVGPMDITGKPMKGWAMVAPEGISEDEDLHRFCGYALEYVGELPPK